MKADINVTPLIDVLLVLLIIFMVVTPGTPTALDASLPRTPEGSETTHPTGLVLEVQADAYLLDARPLLDSADLAARLRQAFETRADRTLFVRVGPGVGYARVIEALDAARACGAGRIGLVDTP